MNRIIFLHLPIDCSHSQNGWLTHGKKCKLKQVIPTNNAQRICHITGRLSRLCFCLDRYPPTSPTNASAMTLFMLSSPDWYMSRIRSISPAEGSLLLVAGFAGLFSGCSCGQFSLWIFANFRVILSLRMSSFQEAGTIFV